MNHCPTTGLINTIEVHTTSTQAPGIKETNIAPQSHLPTPHCPHLTVSAPLFEKTLKGVRKSKNEKFKISKKINNHKEHKKILIFAKEILKKAFKTSKNEAFKVAK